MSQREMLHDSYIMIELVKKFLNNYTNKMLVMKSAYHLIILKHEHT